MKKFIDIAYLSQLYNYVDYIAAMNMFVLDVENISVLEANKGMATIIYTLGTNSTCRCSPPHISSYVCVLLQHCHLYWFQHH